MKSLFKKVRGNKKGFTLAELLVVVAIVGILVAISVPVFTAQLGKARRATNNANLRAAKAAAVAQYLTDDSNNNGQNDKVYVYDVDAGTVATTDTAKGDDVVINDDSKVSNTVIYKSVYVSIPKSNDAGGDVEVTLKASKDAPSGTNTDSTEE